MRVTQNMLTRMLTNSIQSDLEYLQRLNEQLTTGKKVNAFSDDPEAAAVVLRLSRENDSYATYLQHIQTIDGMLSVATTSLQQVSMALSKVRELAVQAVTGTTSDVSLAPIADAISNELAGLIALANIQYNGAYIFSGESVHTLPFAPTKDDGTIRSVTYAGQSTTTEVPIGPRTTTQSNVVGSSVFQANGDLFQTVIALRDAVAAGDRQKINDLLDDIQASSTDVRQALVRLGEKQNQLQFTQTATEQFVNLNTQTISNKEDADMAEVSVKYNLQMAQLQIIMKVAAQAVPPSLVEFL